MSERFDQMRSFLATGMGRVFPCPATDDASYGRRGGPPIMVYREAIPLLSPEAIGTYCTAAFMASQGDAVDISTLASRMKVSESSVQEIVDELMRVGLFLTPEESAAQRAAWERLMYGGDPAPGKKKRKALVPPDPWPSFLPGRWEGTRLDMAGWPVPGTPIVYWLYGTGDELLYVGSTANAWDRLQSHGGKPWVRYIALECSDREAAYWLEAEAILHDNPPLNRDRSVGGRCAKIAKLQARGGVA